MFFVYFLSCKKTKLTLLLIVIEKSMQVSPQCFQVIIQQLDGKINVFRERGKNEQCGRTKLVPLSTKNKTHFLQFQCGTMT